MKIIRSYFLHLIVFLSQLAGFFCPNVWLGFQSHLHGKGLDPENTLMTQAGGVLAEPGRVFGNHLPDFLLGLGDVAIGRLLDGRMDQGFDFFLLP